MVKSKVGSGSGLCSASFPSEQIQAEREEVDGVQSVCSAAADGRDAARRRDVRPAERGEKHRLVKTPSPLRVLCVLSVLSPVQSKYKGDGIRSLSQSFYSQLPETAETQLAKTVSELQSEVRTC